MHQLIHKINQVINKHKLFIENFKSYYLTNPDSEFFINNGNILIPF
jgi:hypothetical protein